MARAMLWLASMRGFLVLVGSPLVATIIFWLLFGACIAAPLDPSPPLARIVTTWDPLECGPPHRVVVELANGVGDAMTGSMPCNAGSVALDAPHLGSYHGLVYAEAPMRSIAPLAVALDQPVVYVAVETPR